MATRRVTLKIIGEPTIVGRKLKDDVRLSKFEVLLDGLPIGIVERVMLTRERRTPGRRYVNARWQSPGWRYRPGATPYGWGGREVPSRREGVERLLIEVAGLGFNESYALSQETSRDRG